MTLTPSPEGVRSDLAPEAHLRICVVSRRPRCCKTRFARALASELNRTGLKVVLRKPFSIRRPGEVMVDPATGFLVDAEYAGDPYYTTTLVVTESPQFYPGVVPSYIAMLDSDGRQYVVALSGEPPVKPHARAKSILEVTPLEVQQWYFSWSVGVGDADVLILEGLGGLAAPTEEFLECSYYIVASEDSILVYPGSVIADAVRRLARSFYEATLLLTLQVESWAGVRPLEVVSSRPEVLARAFIERMGLVRGENLHRGTSARL